MASAYIVTRRTADGGPRFHVKYRVNGRTSIRHAGAFVSRKDAEIRLALVREQLAAGATTVRLTDIPQPNVGRWVYFVRHGLNGPIKIGSARNVAARIRTLQGGNPVALHLLAVLPCHGDEETTLHAAFADARLQGEWFRPTDALLAYIAELSQEVEWENGLEPSLALLPAGERP